MPEPEAGLAPRHGRLLPVDWLLLGYSAVVVAVVAVRAATLPQWPWLITAHLLIALLIWLVRREGLGPVGRALAALYPLLLLVGLYSELDILNSGRVVHDTLVQHWEQALFGGQPSRDWWRTHPSVLWSFILHGTYLAYYPVLALPAFWLAARGRAGDLQRFVLAVMLAFVSCYLCFVFMPVAGPYYAFPRPDGPFVETLTARWVYDALSSGSSFGAAFPSSHVAATVAALLAGWRASRRLGLVLLLPTLLLIVAVVYCQMHYAVDALAGLAVGIAAGTLGSSARA
ncbi:MAG TPA: phosphatase PAP2 family protein [Gemmatimonadales bacterium]|nr:phosphatase PAP2 family protein [Gemmatimonadales bacterium]